MNETGYKPKRATDKSRLGLRDMLGYLPLERAVMVEVGSYAGESALLFANSDKIQAITCVDPWEGEHFSQVEPYFDQHTYGNAKITKLKLPSVEAAELFADESLDFVYIDGNHDLEAVRADIRAWMPKLKEKGWLGGHDYYWEWPGVLQGVFELVGKPRMVFRDGSWVVPRKPLRE